MPIASSTLDKGTGMNNEGGEDATKETMESGHNNVEHKAIGLNVAKYSHVEVILVHVLGLVLLQSMTIGDVSINGSSNLIRKYINDRNYIYKRKEKFRSLRTPMGALRTYAP